MRPLEWCARGGGGRGRCAGVCRVSLRRGLWTGGGRGDERVTFGCGPTDTDPVAPVPAFDGVEQTRAGGGVGTRPRYLIVCLGRRLWASRHCSF